MLFCPVCSNLLIVGHNKDACQASTDTISECTLESVPGSAYDLEVMWVCQACPYRFEIRGQVTSRIRLKRKEIDDVLGGVVAWKNVDSTDGAFVHWNCVETVLSARPHPDECMTDLTSPTSSSLCALLPSEPVATCPKCDHDRAYYFQLQVRSADEPMTTFYRCTKPSCTHQWREG
ncbi:unnamed protein product [Parajaminaea phylloscopi]